MGVLGGGDVVTVLVTGATGFIGGWCVHELVRRGRDVRATARSAARGDELGVPYVVADLTADDGWDEAMDGCDAVLHVASPLGSGDEVADEDLIGPARDGAVRVVRAAAAAGVRRVVLTSAANAASPTSYEEDGVTDEALWTDLSAPDLPAYRRSKTLAERAAWDEAASLGVELTTVLPGAVFGPLLHPETAGSVDVIRRLVTGAMPAVPRIGLEVVDVRDLVELHLLAMDSPAAAGERFLGTGDFCWMADLARILREGLGPDGDRVPTATLTDDEVRELAEVVPQLRGILPGLGRRNRHSTAKAERVLGWTRRPVEETVLDCARSLSRPAPR